jgi:hypothetical protein
MTYKEITNFQDVVMFELQKRMNDGAADKRLKFGEIWKLCAAAAINLPNCPPEALKRNFSASLLWALETLETMRFIAIHTRQDGDRQKITHVTLTMAGMNYLRQTIFTHQGRMGNAIG